MDLVPYIRVIALFEAAFAGVFFFLDRRHPSKFTRFLAWAWAIEAVRALIQLRNVGVPHAIANHWFAASDGLGLTASWCLLTAFSDIAQVRIPRAIKISYFSVCLPLVVFFRYLAPLLLTLNSVPRDRSDFLGVLCSETVLFAPTFAIRMVVLAWLVGIWRGSRLPGALVAMLFCIPYAVGAAAYPFQYYYGYNPPWVMFLGYLRALGFSVGLVMLILDRQLEALKKGEARLAAAQLAARLGSWEVDVLTGFRVWSAEFFRLTGFDPRAGTPSDTDVLGVVHTEDRPGFARYYSADPKDGERPPCTFRVLGPDGVVTWIEGKSDVVLGPSKEALRVTGTALDVTERIASEDAQGRLEEQLRQSQRLEAVGTLANGIAHDFNGILTAIKCSNDLAMSEPGVTQEMRSLLTDVRDASDSAAALVRQILAFSRKQPVKRVPQQLHSAVSAALRLMRATLPQSIGVKLEIDEGSPTVLVDYTQTIQVVMNLLNNAVFALQGRTGTITLRLETFTSGGAADAPRNLNPGRYVCLSVADTGCGMGEEKLKHIFEPFFTTRGPGEGTGLGLSVVQGIMRDNAGLVSVSSREGEGTTFRLYFPEHGTARA